MSHLMTTTTLLNRINTPLFSSTSAVIDKSKKRNSRGEVVVSPPAGPSHFEVRGQQPPGPVIYPLLPVPHEVSREGSCARSSSSNSCSVAPISSKLPATAVAASPPCAASNSTVGRGSGAKDQRIPMDEDDNKSGHNNSSSANLFNFNGDNNKIEVNYAKEMFTPGQQKRSENPFTYLIFPCPRGFFSLLFFYFKKLPALTSKVRNGQNVHQAFR